MRTLLFTLALSLFFATMAFAQEKGQSKVQLSESTFGAITARHIGPARMSGRVTAMDAFFDDERLLYVGSGGGGVWKSSNGGVTFKPVFDEHTMSIGAVSIDQNHPDTVWVGTGEPWVRNSVSVGDGIYKTTDGGENWRHLGLALTERIARIEVNPINPEEVFVAALGELWDANEERGVFRTKDGGTTWEKVLYIDQNTGAADLSIDPKNPNIIYAAMWDHRRTAHSFDSGGNGSSGLYQSMDGGDTWKKLEGLYDGKMGRIAVDVSPADSKVVYALVESDSSALYKSEDKGANWEKVNQSTSMGERPFYFSYLLADPTDSDIVYKPGLALSTSYNGGKTFTGGGRGGSGFHSDVHAIWVSKKDPNMIYLGTDGGVYTSNDAGTTWRMFRNLPISQFYHVSADNQVPYNVYGGLQDNGSWMGPSTSLSGINNGDWENLGGGDGFYVFPDKLDDNIVYWQSQGGNIQRLYRNTREVKSIKPKTGLKGEKLRFNWNTPVAFSNDGKRMYVGAQHLFRSNTKGDDWERISPDLTSNNPYKLKQKTSGGITTDNTGAENHCTIYAISESALDQDYIWVGTDDGQIQVTANGGHDWYNVTADIPELPSSTWVSSVYASQHDLTTAYVSFDGHRSGDKNSYVYKTEDLGASWKRIYGHGLYFGTSPDPNATKQKSTDVKIARDQLDYVHKVIEDPVNPNLLFIGTESGLQLSVDGGENWNRFTSNMPRVAVRDMMIHPTQHDLILATHGRGIIIIDDISPLRDLTTEVLEKDIAFLSNRPYTISSRGFQQTFDGNDEFVGSNPEQAAQITYYLKKRHIFGEMYIEILDEDNNLINKLPAGKRKGINRVPLNINFPAPKMPASSRRSFGANSGPSLLPGKYKVRIVRKKEVTEGSFEILKNPDSPHSLTDLKAQNEAAWRAFKLVEDLAYLDAKVLKLAKDVSATILTAKGKNLKRDLTHMETAMNVLHDDLVAKPVPGESIFSSGGDEKLREKIVSLYGAINNFSGAPSLSQLDELDLLTTQLQVENERFDKAIKKLAHVNTELEKLELDPLEVLSMDEFEK